MSIFNNLKKTIDRLFTRHLLLTNTAIAVGFMGAGDAIQQILEKKLGDEKPFDKKRTRNMMGGGLVFGPLGHVWYSFLDRRFPGAKTLTVAKKLGCEMAIGPPLILVIFLSVGLLEGKEPMKSFNEFKDNIITICFAEWAVYIPLQALNFYFLPPRFRVLYVSGITLLYDVFLSYIIHKEDNKQRNLKKALN